ncbi:MAG: glycosyltransferase [Trichocoleus desertorum ATA4-8-CV12]|jgi:glycosyltransferase involved in cell wall biosynthesis|nr:glycosyltransferase [Trichocoleus desertorum ATA4-8-CV12]
MPLVSVIIPAYNAETTIQKTVTSVLEQSLQDFELIIVNDGSTDKTLDVIEHIVDPRIKVFSYPNSGAAVSRNRGFAQTTGEFIAFLDADDLWTPEKLEAQWQALQENPQAQVAYSWTDIIDQSGQRLGQGDYTVANGKVYAKLLLCCFIVSGSNTLIRRGAYVAVGGFDESLVASQDFDLYLRLAARYQFVSVAAPHVLYRFSSNSMCTNIRRMEETSLAVRERAFHQAPEPLSAVLKQHSIANFYKCALFRIMNEPLSRKRGLEIAWLLYNAIKYDPALMRRRIVLKIVLNILIITALPSKYAKFILSEVKGLANSRALLGYVRVDPEGL